MARDKPAEKSGFTRTETVMALVMFPMGITAGVVSAVVLDLNIVMIFVHVAIGILVALVVWVTVSVMIFSMTEKGPTKPGEPKRHAAQRGKSNVNPEPTLKRDDLEWTRSGDVIRGTYRDFIIHMKTFPETRNSKFFVTVQVLHLVRSIGTDRADSHDAAIEKGLSVIRRHLEADRATEQIFDKLVGKRSEARDPLSPAVTVNRDRRDFQRYMA